jgi:predicted metal-binding membrane protein
LNISSLVFQGLGCGELGMLEVAQVYLFLFITSSISFLRSKESCLSFYLRCWILLKASFMLPSMASNCFVYA